jgi:hypothetical protein
MIDFISLSFVAARWGRPVDGVGVRATPRRARPHAGFTANARHHRRSPQLITKYAWTATTPRAHITNQRTVEIFRDLDIEDDIKADGTPQRMMGDTAFCTSLTGEEIGRVRTWGTQPAGTGGKPAAPRRA